MNSSRKLYWILGLLSLGAYGWIGYHLLHTGHPDDGAFTVCLFKNLTGLPCPSCGVTRSVLLLLQGEINQALLMNPIGVLAMVFLIVIPLWILRDVLRGKDSLIVFYNKTEELVQNQKLVYIPLFTLITLNWIWNITKGL